MREILFRGKRLSDGKWVDGSLFVDEKEGKYEILVGYGTCRVVRAVDPATVSQYTGQKDMDGVRIYEGDISKFSYTGKNKGVEGTESVVFKNGMFGVEWGWHRELVALDGFANTMIEVIGNIHDNPELLGGC